MRCVEAARESAKSVPSPVASALVFCFSPRGVLPLHQLHSAMKVLTERAVTELAIMPVIMLLINGVSMGKDAAAAVTAAGGKSTKTATVPATRPKASNAAKAFDAVVLC